MDATLSPVAIARAVEALIGLISIIFPNNGAAVLFAKTAVGAAPNVLA